MKDQAFIRSPQLLEIAGNGTAHYYGANQEWFRQYHKRMAGCGPTSGTHLLWYLSRTRESCAALDPFEAKNKFSLLQLMERVWKYITPGLRGVDSTEKLMRGIERYGEDHNVPLTCNVLNIPRGRESRPAEEAVLRFIAGAFALDLPVAFLNLDNGGVANLDNWHWVTLVGIKSGRFAVMYDQGRRSEIDLHLWLKNTKLGGGFVVAGPA